MDGSTPERFLPTTPSQMLEIRGLSIRYVQPGQNPVYPVKCVNLRVDAGEVVGIIGESGSGKSTLAAALLKLLPAHADYLAGSVLFDGRDVLAMSESELNRIRGDRIAMISQDPATSLNPVLRIGTQVSEVLRAHRPMLQSKTRTLELLRQVGLADPERIAAAYPHELSGGQRQRIVIAQAIACNPKLLIADEPTSKLDAKLQAEMLALFLQVVRRQATALIFITHDPALLIGVADRIVVMYAGCVVEEGRAAEIFENPQHPYTQSLLRLFAFEQKRHLSRIDELPAIAGEAPGLTYAGPGCGFEPRCQERMPHCSTENPSQSAISQTHRVSCFKHAN